jgi:hypothetical protein
MTEGQERIAVRVTAAGSEVSGNLWNMNMNIRRRESGEWSAGWAATEE